MEARYYHQTGGCSEIDFPMMISDCSFLDCFRCPGSAE